MSTVIKTNIIYLKDNTEYIFKEVFITNSYKYNDLMLPEVSGEIIGERINRRSTPRFTVNKECIFTPGPHRIAEEACIKDISMDGISIVTKVDTNVGDIIAVSFKNAYNDRQHINVKARIARIFEDDSDKSNKVYGCKITNNCSLYNKYVMEIQRNKIRIKV